MKLYFATVLLAIFVTTKAQVGFYWRDYDGTIPVDAFPAGVDDLGDLVYVGLTNHRDLSVLPGTIRTDQKKVFYEYDLKEFSKSEDVKILCSAVPERLRWIKTKEGKFTPDLKKHKSLIPAGSDRSRPLIVGRVVLEDGDALVGKVIDHNNVFSTIWVSKDGKGWSTSSFEVLVYDPSAPNGMLCTKRPIIINLYN